MSMRRWLCNDLEKKVCYGLNNKKNIKFKLLWRKTVAKRKTNVAWMLHFNEGCMFLIIHMLDNYAKSYAKIVTRIKIEQMSRIVSFTSNYIVPLELWVKWKIIKPLIYTSYS